jgi:hypothetical protein
MQHLAAVGEQRRTTLTEIQPSVIDLREERDQFHSRFALSSGESFHAREQLVVCQVPEFRKTLHSSL